MKKVSKIPLIKKIIQLQPEHPGTISKQQYKLAGGGKSKVYWVWQTSKAGEKISIRLKDDEVSDLKSFITELKHHNRIKHKKEIRMVDVFKSEVSKLSQAPGKGNFENETK